MSQNIARLLVKIIALLGVVLILSQFVVYVVDQREQAVVLRLGKPIQARTEPGLYFKVPFIDTVRMLPATLQFWGDSGGEVMPDLPTRDNKKIELIPWAVWKINDPIAFVQRLRSIENAENRVAQFAKGAIRDAITQYDLEDLVRSTNREMKITQLEFDDEDLELLQQALPEAALEQKPKSKGLIGREAILEKINAAARKNLDSTEGESRGIELIEVGISHIDFVEAVRKTTFDRWIAEREAISTRTIKQGEQAKQEILNKTNAEIEKIRGDGQRLASEIRGKADAEVIRRYAEAISEVGDFYTFVRTLEAYEKSMTGQTEIILTTDNDFLKQLQHIGTPKITPPTAGVGDYSVGGRE